MNVYFSKINLGDYVIYPEPEQEELINYVVLDIKDNINPDDFTLVIVNGEYQVIRKLVDISLLKEQVRQDINTLRDKKINGGIYVSAIDKWIDTDATAERNILSVKATFDLFGDQEIPWTFADNSVAMINKEKLLVIWQVLMEAKTNNHANALKHKAMVEQVENPLEYDYSSGWTQTYEEFVNEQI
ncbi:DUF4376 domain-containing protein [Glaesserella parasuis]|nr:DUF4376 domain-containing protein [Glaesserella parasuis]